MCGIVGIINGTGYRTASKPLCDYLANAIVADSLRGMDSTGIVQKGRDRKMYWAKEAVDGSTFVKMPVAHGYIRDADDSPFTLVHNRAATEGKVTAKNAHPFEHLGNGGKRWVIGVHNGTLNDWKKYQSAEGFEVDSDWALSRIAEEKEDAFTKFDGAYTFVWYDDEKPDSLFMARNALRPMWINYIKGTNRMIFGSEAGMMAWLAGRNGLQVDGPWISLEQDYLFEFSLDNPREFKKTRLVSVYSVKMREDFLKKVTEAASKKPTALQSFRQGSDHKRGRRASRDTGGVEPLSPRVTADEREYARFLDLLGAKVTVTMEFYDTDKGEMWCTAKEDGIEYSAVVRKVSKSDADLWMTFDEIELRIGGAEPIATGVEPCLILIPTATTPRTSYVVDAETALAEALHKAIVGGAEETKDANASGNA